MQTQQTVEPQRTPPQNADAPAWRASEAAGQTSPLQKPRSTLIDAARGLAIILVVVGHTSQGMRSRGLWHGSTFSERLDAWMYSFHMPAFFFMAGLFLLGSIAKRGTPRFLRDRASALLWPYALIEVVNTVLQQMAGHLSHTPGESLRGLLWNFFTAAGAWFLPSLFFALAVFALFRRLTLPVLLVLALVARAYYQKVPINFAAAGLFFLSFVVLGAILGSRVQQVQRIPRSVSLLVALLLGWGVWFGAARGWQWHYATGLLLSVAGTLMLLLLARLLEGTAVAGWLAWCGEASLGIFLLAPYPQVAVRTLLTKLHVTGAVPQLTLSSLAAVLLGAWVYHHRKRLRMTWIFAFPWSKTQS